MVKMTIKEFLILDVSDEQLIRNPAIQELCNCNYYDKNGCPNYNKDYFKPYVKGFEYISPCPPHAHMIDQIAECPWTLVCAVCDFKQYLDDMKEKHKNWSDRQLRNVLYWQGSVKARLRKKTEEAISEDTTKIYFDRPEAHGVNVFQTMKYLGYELEFRPKKTLYMINLIACKKGNKRQRLNW